MSVDRAWGSMPGVAFSFWAALSALSGLGLRYPLAMLPLLFLQLLYKLVYVLAVGLPLEFEPGREISVASVFIGGAVLDVVVIPWRFAVGRFVRSRGDRWRAASRAAHAERPGARAGTAAA